MMGTKAIPIYIPAKRPRLGTIGKEKRSVTFKDGTEITVE